MLRIVIKSWQPSTRHVRFYIHDDVWMPRGAKSKTIDQIYDCFLEEKKNEKRAVEL